jgi:hypothetical protein
MALLSRSPALATHSPSCVPPTIAFGSPPPQPLRLPFGSLPPDHPLPEASTAVPQITARDTHGRPTPVRAMSEAP